MSDIPQVWAPWRSLYIKEKPQPTGCLFCRSMALPAEERREGLVLAVRTHAFVMMNRYPYTGGHLMVSPTTHAANLEELTEDAHDALFRLVRDSAVIIKEIMKPHGINIGINLGEAAGAGIASHLHVHLVPRWNGDCNFMTTTAGIRVISEALLASYDALSPRFSFVAER